MWFPCASFDLDEWEEDTLPGKTKEDLKKKIPLPDGSHAMECVGCHKEIQWAETNLPDETFRCYKCSNGI